MEPALHPDVQPLAFLLGRWRGGGEGVWPPGDPFRYGEETTLDHVGDDFLLFAMRSWSADDGSPLHFERGFFRPAGQGRVELMVAHPNGIVEMAEGALGGCVVDVASTTLARSATASPVTMLRRRIEVAGDVLRYELWMGMRGEAPARHLVGELRRS